MPKPLEIASDYQCPYRQACPHLQGMSTEGIWHRHELDRQQAQQDRERIDQWVEWLNERDQQVRQLEQESQQLRAQLKALHQKQFKANPPAPTPQEASVAPKTKRGAPVGHPPWQWAAPDHLDQKNRRAAARLLSPLSVCQPASGAGNCGALAGRYCDQAHEAGALLYAPTGVVPRL